VSQRATRLYDRVKAPWVDPKRVLQDLKSPDKNRVVKALAQLEDINLDEVDGPLFISFIRQTKSLGSRPGRSRMLRRRWRYNPEPSVSRLAKKARMKLIRRRMAQKRESQRTGLGGLMDYGLDEAMALRNPRSCRCCSHGYF
jgi:hypothetical protein